MKNIIILLTISACLLFAILISGCSFQMSIESTKKPSVVEVVKEKPVAVAKKSNYQRLKDEHNAEWLNLPHRESENELFQAK